ncbi:helix-turn-helix domain-containing protein [Pseudidiomarina sp.]|uniref:helix-turn-helix domain-containing protein n=1 Tax=Pseudidiomarina sp. TaxID=2081707 RepID=UPI003A97CC51
MTLGDYLKQQRNDRELSQADLADKMGVEQSYLSKLEGERSLPSAEILSAWLSALYRSRRTHVLLRLQQAIVRRVYL